MKKTMFLDMFFVEMLAHDGTMNSFYIKPKSENERVINELLKYFLQNYPYNKHYKSREHSREQLIL